MPALLLHLTAAKETTARSDVPQRVARANARHLDAFLLGSVLPDLPYHACFGRQLLRHLLRRAYLESEWGEVFHFRGTGRLALALLAHLRRSHLGPEVEDRVLALTAGYLSHVALDRMVHPVINQLVRRHLTPPEHPSVLHSRLERYQSLFYHLDRLGFDIAGSSHPRALVLRVAGTSLFRPALDGPLWRAFRSASVETHGRSPAQGQLVDWLWGVTAYGYLMSSPLGWSERLTGDLQHLRASFYQGPEVDLLTPLSAAMQLTISFWEAALDVLLAERLNHEVRQVFLRRVGEVDLATGD